MRRDLAFGIQTNGIKHTHDDPMPDIDTRFAMAREAGVFDYVDKTPAPDEVEQFLKASEKYDLPVRCGGWFYTVGRDEELIRHNLELGRRLGSIAHNVQIMATNADGRLTSDEEVLAFYERALEHGEKCGVAPCLEVHVNMWSEDFRRVEVVGEAAEARGLPFQMTLDHSHVIFKIDHPEEQQVFDIGPDVASGALVLDPLKDDHVCGKWIGRNWIRHCHARAAVPNNPRNTAARDDNGNPGRGIQYPFKPPAPGEYHADWSEDHLEPWKEVMRQLFRWHAANEHSVLGQVSTEFIPNLDYGEGCKYSLFEQGIACVAWMRQAWADAQAEVNDG